jgi:hypothetical protein
LLQLVLFAGFSILILVGLILTAVVLSKPGTAFATLFEAYAFLANPPATTSPTIPAALSSDAALSHALTAGMLSIQGIIVVLVVAILVLLALIAGGYAKSLSLSIIAEEITHQRTDFLSMFSRARLLWRRTTLAYAPYYLFLLVLIVLFVPLWILSTAQPLLHGELRMQATPLHFAFVGVMLVALILRVSTLSVDAHLIDGKRFPLRAALRYNVRNAKSALWTALLLCALAVLMFAVWLYLGSLPLQGLGEFLVTLFFAALVSVWRMFVSAYVVARWREKNQVLRGSPSA